MMSRKILKTFIVTKNGLFCNLFYKKVTLDRHFLGHITLEEIKFLFVDDNR